jgi:PIN domain nuclease of toxin-antitoxin system
MRLLLETVTFLWIVSDAPKLSGRAGESALHLTRLPMLHKDPFDRMLVCQAITQGLLLLTPDPVRTAW